MQKYIYLLLFLILTPFVLGYRSALQPMSTLDRYMSERDLIGFLSKDNYWTGNNTFLNVTYLNENVQYVNISYNISNINFIYTNIKGNVLSGSDGESDRTYISDPEMITIDNYFLQPTIDYTESGGTITFKNPIWDTQDITLIDTEVSITSSNILGNALSGSDGATSRTYAVTNVLMIVVDNYNLQINIDYTVSSTSVTFINKVWNDQRITIWQY